MNIKGFKAFEPGNTGRHNTGYRNTGNSNAGDWNAGNRNAGDWNCGNWNVGDWNVGNYNTGDYNIGDWNAGDWNAGNYNTGNHNTGDWNAGNCNTGDWNRGSFCTGDFNITDHVTGCFCTEEPKIRFFDKESEMTFREWRESEAYRILCRIEPAKWVLSEEMSAEEKAEHPEHETTGGYLKIKNRHEAFADWWNSLSYRDKDIIRSIPNFDAEKFALITGIPVIKIEES